MIETVVVEKEVEGETVTVIETVEVEKVVEVEKTVEVESWSPKNHKKKWNACPLFS